MKTFSPMALLGLALALAIGPAPDRAQAAEQIAQAAPPPPNVRRGPQPDLLRPLVIQGLYRELAAHGYDSGPPRAQVSDRLQAAIREYQRDAGLPVTGQATPALLDHLKFALPKVFKGQARTASDRALVTAIQQELARRGFDPGRADGIAGTRTRTAIMKFQTSVGLAADGRPSPSLLDRLRRP